MLGRRVSTGEEGVVRARLNHRLQVHDRLRRLAEGVVQPRQHGGALLRCHCPDLRQNVGYAAHQRLPRYIASLQALLTQDLGA